MCMMRRQHRRTSISAVFAMFLFPVGLLKYRTKSRKGSPWVIILVSSKKVLFRVLVISRTLSPERPLKTTFGQEV